MGALFDEICQQGAVPGTNSFATASKQQHLLWNWSGSCFLEKCGTGPNVNPFSKYRMKRYIIISFVFWGLPGIRGNVTNR